MIVPLSDVSYYNYEEIFLYRLTEYIARQRDKNKKIKMQILLLKDNVSSTVHTCLIKKIQSA